MMYSITIRRQMPQRPRTSIEDQLKYILGVALRGARGTSWGWQVVNKTKKERVAGGNYICTVALYFEKTRGRRSDPDTVEGQWDRIQEMVAKAGSTSKFNKYPWVVVDNDAAQAPEEEEELLAEADDTIVPEADASEEEVVENSKPEGVRSEVPPGVHDILVPSKVLTLEDLKAKFPHDLMNGTDDFIENHEAFRGIYGRGAQVRSTLSSIWSFIQSGGERANHTLLWGKPACAKTQILLRVLNLFGEGAVLRLDATSTTRAGLERLIFKQLKVVPPLFFMEEIEKADEQALRIWLGAMDDRHEFRKVNFHQCQVRKVHFMAMATANDKDKFDAMMGGRPNYPGALSSRYVHQLECPRPNETQMRMILQRDIARFGGKPEWVDPCIKLSKDMGTDDPRKVLGFLDGGDRLLDGSYQKDQLLIYGKVAS